jgi:hypothetical protein
MNLEPRVSPEALNGEQWEWMKRYRVWEANRKSVLVRRELAGARATR